MNYFLLGATLGMVLALSICIAVERFFWRGSINHRSPKKIRAKRKKLFRPRKRRRREGVVFAREVQEFVNERG